MTVAPRTDFITRLLRRLVPATDHDALLGDLREERQRGRSMAWYVFQIVAAIVVGCCRDIWTHRLLTLRAIGIGIVALVLYLVPAGALFNFVQRHLQDGILVGNHWIYWRPFPQSLSWTIVSYVTYVWLCGGLVFSGWAIGRLNRAHGITFVVAFAAALVMVLLAFVRVTVTYPPHLPYPNTTDISWFLRVVVSLWLLVRLAVSLLWLLLCVVIGGYLATRRPNVV